MSTSDDLFRHLTKFFTFSHQFFKFHENSLLGCPPVLHHAPVTTFFSSFLLYCIVLYLYIYIALLAVHTNQKRFQCKRPREKKAVLRERKEALGSPVNKADRVEGRSWFQSVGPMIAKARV